MNQGILSMSYTLIQLIFLGVDVVCTITVYHYALKRGQISIDLYLNIINSGYLGPHLKIYKGLKRTLLFDEDTYLVPL